GRISFSHKPAHPPRLARVNDWQEDVAETSPPLLQQNHVLTHEPDPKRCRAFVGVSRSKDRQMSAEVITSALRAARNSPIENDLATASVLSKVLRGIGPSAWPAPHRCLALPARVLAALGRNPGQGIDHLTGNVEGDLLGIAEFWYLGGGGRGGRGCAPGSGNRRECRDRGPPDPQRICWRG